MTGAVALTEESLRRVVHAPAAPACYYTSTFSVLQIKTMHNACCVFRFQSYAIFKY